MRDIARLLREVSKGMTADQSRIADEAADEIDALRAKLRRDTVPSKTPEQQWNETVAAGKPWPPRGDHWYREWGDR